ncbi:MAG: 2-C-methyl-D-erythritol 2,4-cyclodiphosphate synthase [Clostridia bacterium]|nr:2-C-methyl-D-erythritol 2,4-cyclodiphosphate synthase [Clostridia bacterium]
MSAAGSNASGTTRPTVTAIVCAAGKGTRAGFEKNKLLMPFAGICVLERTLTALLSFGFDEILVTSSPADLDEISALCEKYGAHVILGGATRFLSVYNALKQATGDIVLVHDGARPFVSRAVLEGCEKSVKEHGSGVCALPVTDTVGVAENGKLVSYPARASTYKIQTPQGFWKAELITAYERAIAEEKTDFTDDSSVFAAYAHTPTLCAGAEENVKLTYAQDFTAAFGRVGFGVDTHAFGKAQEYILLGGVKIPAESGLIAHSDGDVLCHAVMDALLSAAGLRDIGYYFPDKDEKWRGANSMQMLAEVVRLIAAEGFRAKNLSVAVQAERPRLSKYIGEIRASLAQALGLSETAVGISAGTNEGLGYIGEGKGITVTAAALLEAL